MNKQRKTIITLTLILIITMSMLPLTAQAKNEKNLPKKGFVEKIPVSEDVTMFKEYIPIDLLSLLENQDLSQLPIEQLPDGDYYTVNVYAIEVPSADEGDDTTIVLIDAGHQKLASKLNIALWKEYHKRPTSIYLTHGHVDHAGGGLYFQKKGASVYASTLDAQIIQIGANDPNYPVPDDLTYKPYNPERTYETHDVEDGFNIIGTPGHTLGSVSIMYTSEHGYYMFTGDTIMEIPVEGNPDLSFILGWFTAYNNRLVDSTLPYPVLIPSWFSSLGILGSMLPPEGTVCPGHDTVYPSAVAVNYIGWTQLVLFSLPGFPMP